VKLWKKLKRLFIKPEKSEAMPYSLVLLQRRPHRFSQVDVQAAAERGWGRSFDGQADPMYFVGQKGAVTMVKAGRYLLNILHASETYFGDPQGIAKQLPQEEQKKAWLEHHAWVALDFWNLDLPRAEAYENLARLAIQLADSNCSGVFLPRDEVLMPNDGTAEEGLHLLMKRELL
jgi:hypothetical protein